jgi:16S rRNA A1518/A1519 N6-dimethyltransferase RsmA/KsgA/DIM1 with predicted DNA glycosylase/AP lyase activity
MKPTMDAVRRVYAIELNPRMRAVLAQKLGSLTAVSVLDASAEQITLPDDWVGFISRAQAIHWFEPEVAKRETQRTQWKKR